MRWIIALALLALPAVASAQALAPQSQTRFQAPSPWPVWTLKTWPTAALMVQSRQTDEGVVLLRTLQCLHGDKQVASRTYQRAGEAAPAGAMRCGRTCQRGLKEAEIDGASQVHSYVETRSTIKAARRSVEGGLKAEQAADPWREVSDAPLALMGRMAQACRLPAPQVLQGAKWKGFDQRLVIRVGRPSDSFPYSYPLQGRARDYVAITQPATARSVYEPWVLRVTGYVTKGGAALSLRSGDKALTAEAAISAQDGPQTIYFEMDPSMAGASLSVRNNDPKALPGVFVLSNLEVAPQAALDEDDRIDLRLAQAKQFGKPLNSGIPGAAEFAAEQAKAAAASQRDAEADRDEPETFSRPAALPGGPPPFQGASRPLIDSYADVNQCRAACATDWLTAQKCTPPTAVFGAPSPALCQRRAKTAYTACLVSCGGPNAPAPPAAPDPKSKSKPKPKS